MEPQVPWVAWVFLVVWEPRARLVLLETPDSRERMAPRDSREPQAPQVTLGQWVRQVHRVNPEIGATLDRLVLQANLVYQDPTVYPVHLEPLERRVTLVLLDHQDSQVSRVL